MATDGSGNYSWVTDQTGSATSDGYIGDTQTHLSGGILNMNNQDVQNVKTLSMYEFPVTGFTWNLDADASQFSIARQTKAYTFPMTVATDPTDVVTKADLDAATSGGGNVTITHAPVQLAAPSSTDLSSSNFTYYDLSGNATFNNTGTIQDGRKIELRCLAGGCNVTWNISLGIVLYDSTPYTGIFNIPDGGKAEFIYNQSLNRWIGTVTD